MTRLACSIVTVGALIAGCATPRPEMATEDLGAPETTSHYLPDPEATTVVSVTEGGLAAASVLIQTHAVSVKENGPAETVARFGEVYAFSPSFVAVHRDEATQFRFWNL